MDPARAEQIGWNKAEMADYITEKSRQITLLHQAIIALLPLIPPANIREAAAIIRAAMRD